MLKPRIMVLLAIGLGICQVTCGTAQAGWPFRDRSSGCGDSGTVPSGCWLGEDDDCNSCRDHECCGCCEKKKVKSWKKCCLFTCFDCAEPPRGEVAVSVAARIDREAFQEVAEQEDTNQENAEAADQRVDVLERDVTRLTLVVEQVAKSQQKQQQDLTRATVILEKLAEKIGPAK